MSQTRKKPRTTVTTQEKKFCNYYLKCWNYGQAYLLAGYKSSPRNARRNGYRLFITPRVQKYWAQLLEKTNEDMLVSRKDIIAGISDIAFSGSNEGSRIKGLKLLSQIKGMLIQKIQHSGAVNTNVDLSKLTIEELKSIAALTEKI